nr:biliverdin-producing heme oxygenase [Microlunatus panaciterrae]
MTPFSESLRRETAREQAEADSSRFLDQLRPGQLSGVSALTAQHYFIYSALEAVAEERRTDTAVAPFLVPGLTRVPALQVDLEHLLGSDWRDRIRPRPTTITYCTRLAELDSGHTFIAHHYTRYLGDVVNGQLVKSQLERRHGLVGPGATFYDLSDLGPAEQFRTRYHALLDSAPWSSGEQQELIAEARLALAHTAAILDDLAQDLDSAGSGGPG